MEKALARIRILVCKWALNGVSPVNDSELQQIRSQLEQMKRGLLEDEQAFNREGARPVELDQSRVGRLSRVDAMQAQQMALDGERRRKLQMVKVEAALARISNKSYGYCSECEEEIDPRRLSINPTNEMCVRCAESKDTVG